MNLLSDVSRCTGRYDGVHGEFGKMLHAQCFGCLRKNCADIGPKTLFCEPPEFDEICPSREPKNG